MNIKVAIGSFALCAVPAACGGGGGGGGGVVYPIQANYVSSSAVQPFGLIKVVVETQNPSAETFLRFTDGLGFDVVVPALEMSDTHATASVPPYENPVTGQIGAGSVSVQVLQRTGAVEELSNPFAGVTIADLPASALAQGDLTLAFLNSIRNLLSTSSTAIIGTTLDTPQNQATIGTAIPTIDALILNVTALQIDPGLVLDFGSIGTNDLFLTQADLPVADRLIAALLAQQSAATQAPSGCSFTCIDTALSALLNTIATGGAGVQGQVDAYFQGGIDCSVMNGLPLAWRHQTGGTVVATGALAEATVTSGAAQALFLSQAYYGLGALSLAAVLDAGTPSGNPELLDGSRDYLDLGSAAAVAALAQSGGSLFAILTSADNVAAISRTAPTYVVPNPCSADLSGRWRGQYTFSITLPAPCPPMITNAGLMELDLTQTPPATAVGGTGRVTELTVLSQTSCSPIGKTAANTSVSAMTNGMLFDGDLTVFAPSAGLSAALPFLGTVGAGPAGRDSISGTFVFPDVTGTFKLDRLDP